MRLSRRDFMKMFGVTTASLLLVRCKQADRLATPTETGTVCYDFGTVTNTPPVAPPASARERLRVSWLGFGKLADETSSASNPGENVASNPLAVRMIAEHRAALDELITAGDISSPVADLVQEAYEAAVYHVWRLNVPFTCYKPVLVDYAPVSAEVLVLQAEALDQVAGQGRVNAETLARARAALERDMAFYALSDEDVRELYSHLTLDYQQAGQPIPSFEALELELTPDAKAAARFIVDLLAVQ
jgi:hypothetical protein